MGAGPVTSPAAKEASPVEKRQSWKLRPPHDTMAHGLVVSGFDHLPFAEALFLRFAWPENGPEGPRVEGWAGNAVNCAGVFLDGPSENGPSPGCTRHFFCAFSGGDVSGRPAPPARRH